MPRRALAALAFALAAVAIAVAGALLAPEARAQDAPAPPPADRLAAIVERFQRPPADAAARDAHYDAIAAELRAFAAEGAPEDLVDDASYWIVEAGYRKGLFQEAIEEYRQFLDRHASSNQAGRARHFLGNSLYKTGQFEAAGDAFAEVGARHQDDALAPLAGYQAGLSYAKAGLVEKARAAYESYLARHPAHEKADEARRALLALARLPPLPDFRAADLDGKEVAAAKLEGKDVLLLFFMAGWDPSVDDLERAGALAAAHGADRLTVVAFALDKAARKDDVRAARGLARFAGPVVHLPDGFGAELAKGLGVGAVPSALLVDRAGNVTQQNIRGAALASAVAARIGQPPKPAVVVGLPEKAPEAATPELLATFGGQLAAARTALAAAAKGTAADRVKAVTALGAIRLDESVAELQAVLGRETDLAVRQTAAQALARIETRRAGRALLPLLADKNDALVSIAVDALARIGRGVASADDLGKVATNRTLKESRVKAAKALRAFPSVASFTHQLGAMGDGEGDDDVEVRLNAEVLENARACTDPAVGAWAVKSVLGRRDPPPPPVLAVGCILASAARGDEDAFRALRKMLKVASPLVREAAAEGLGRLGSAQAVDLLDERLKDPAVEVALAATRALRAIGGEAAWPAILKATQAKDPKVRAVAARALADWRTAEAFKRLVALLSDKVWPVQAQAVAALAERREKEAIPALIEALGRAEKRLRADIRQALVDLTGEDIGDDAGDWRNWWEPRAATFVVPARGKARAGEEAAQSRARNDYFGLEVVSDRLLFIVDISGSMSALQTVKDGEETGGQVTRLDYAKRELIGALSRLGKDVYFNVIVFDHQVESWQPKLTKATAAAVADARAFVEKLTPRGGTNIYDALAAGLADPDVDTIYFLTDGAPSAGRYTDPARILAEVRKLNEWRAIQINTISFAGQAAFLRPLALQNHGVFVER